MIILSQRDPRWGGKTIGKTNVLIKDQGCTITCISMISDYFKSFFNPNWFAKYLNFTPQAKVYWLSINEKKELNFEFEYRYYSDKHPQMFQKIEEAIKDPNKAVILEIRKSHWVVALSKWPVLGYRVADPWPLPSGSKSYKTKSYISGCAVFKRK